jgi:lysophospholipase L1-like esterase
MKRTLLSAMLLVALWTPSITPSAVSQPVESPTPAPGLLEARQLAVAEDPRGGLWAVWELDTGTNVDLGFSYWDGKVWSAAQPVHSRPQAWDRSPSIAVAADGTLWLAWSSAEKSAPSRHRLYTSQWTGKRWTAPQAVPMGGIAQAKEPAVAAAPDGTLWLAWVGFDGVDDEIYASHWDGASWSAATRLSHDEDPSLYDVQPQLAVGTDGRPWVVWTGHQDGPDDEIYASHWTTAGWTPEQMVSQDDDALDVGPTLALDAQGRPWVAWKGRVTDDEVSRLRILVSHWDEAGQVWTAEVMASSPLAYGVHEAHPSLSWDRRGKMHLAWLTAGTTDSTLAYAWWQDDQRAESLLVQTNVDTHDVVLVAAGEYPARVLWLDPLPGSELPLHWAPVDETAVPLEDWFGEQGAAKQPQGITPFDYKYLAFGDSITWGGYPVEDPHYPYPSILQDTLRVRVSPDSVVVNSGVPGEGTYGGWLRIKDEVHDNRTKWVMIMEGTNDVTRQVPIAQTYDYLVGMIDEARKSSGVDDVKVMLATLIPRLDDLNEATEERNQQAIIPAQQAKKHVKLCDPWTAFISYGPWQGLYWDDKHPNQNGLQLLADTFYGCLISEFGIVQESVPPTAQISYLPPASECGLVEVGWTGSDNLTPPEALRYDVQMNVNGGAFSDWLVDTTLTSAAFASEDYNYTLGFRVRARDLVGNQSLFSTPAYTTITDSVSPAAYIGSLRAVQLAPFTVSWSGSDACSGIDTYDVQYKVGAAGTWMDWKMGTTATSDTFAPSTAQYGETYYFHAGAHDKAGNWSGWFETSTKLARHSLGGTAYNVRHQPVAATQAQVTPDPLWLGPQPTGFLAYTTISGDHSITVSRTILYGSLPTKYDVPVNQNVSGLEFVLPPVDDQVTDGDFEAVDLAAWHAGGTLAPTLTHVAHTGDGAVRLDGSLSDSRLSQGITPALGISDPTLSFLVCLAADGLTSTLQIELANSGTLSPPVTYTLPVETIEWTHVWYDLTGQASEALTLTFVVSGSAAVILDEVRLGSALQHGHWLYLPFISRGW